jgi:hypothetical protein
MPEHSAEKWDVFISHASEDKQAFVEPLANALSAFGVNVWYDKFALKIGDSLSRSIDRGLAKSDYGLVVLSPSFIAKKWTEYELRGLTARELAGGKIILPVWYNISRTDLLEFSPTLTDKVAVLSDGLTPAQVAVEIIKVARPDIFTRITRRLAHYELWDRSERIMMDPSEIVSSENQHSVLPPELVSRIRLVRASLLGVFPHTMNWWIDGFMKDNFPSKEVECWERIAASYMEYCSVHPRLTDGQYKLVFRFLLMRSLGCDDRTLRKIAAGLPVGAAGEACVLLGQPLPVYEFDEKIHDDDHAGAQEALRSNIPNIAVDFIIDDEHPRDQEASRKKTQELDKEHFPKDMPEDLVRSLMGTGRSSRRK